MYPPELVHMARGYNLKHFLEFGKTIAVKALPAFRQTLITFLNTKMTQRK